MNAINTNHLIKGVVLALLALISPLLVLGDVHLAHQNHPCEVEQQSPIDELPWHPHGACSNDVETDHSDLKPLIQKSIAVDIHFSQLVCYETSVHDHGECQQATSIVDKTHYFAADLYQVLSIFLI